MADGRPHGLHAIELFTAIAGGLFAAYAGDVLAALNRFVYF